ncbi:PAS domain S-box protein [Parasediminibacterium paludis]|uniref:histidine kinase n=1 Tax=Parasediminibacterium paludis TaxID=908966 RepID=A0ABV8PZC3_9BACT
MTLRYNNQLFNAFPLPSLLLKADLGFTIINTNHAYSQLFNTNDDSIIEKSILTLSTYASSESNIIALIQNSLEIVLATKKPHTIQEVAIPSNLFNNKFKVKYFTINNTPLVGEDGDVECIVHSVTDITDSVTLRNLEIDDNAKLNNQTINLNKISNASLDVICAINAEGYFLYASNAAKTVWGYSPDELVGKHFTTFLHPDDVAKSLQTAKLVMKGIEIDAFENRYIKKDGTPVLMEWTVRFDKVEKIRYGVARNITEKKRNEIALIESENRYRNLFSNNPSPMIVWDFETLKIIDCNAEALLLYGYSKEAFLQLSIKDLRLKEDIELIEAETKSEEIYGQIHKKIWRHKKSNGELFYANITGHLLQYKGKKSSLVCINDVTDKINTENALRTSELKLRTAQQVAQIGYWDFDFKTDNLTWSDELYNVFGITKALFHETHQSFVELVDEEDRAFVLQTSKHTQQTGEAFTIDYRITTPSGEKRVIQEHGYGELDESGNVIRLFGTAQNITDRKLAEEKIRESNQRYEYVTKATSDAIWDWDLIHDKVYWGDGFESIFGYKLDSLISNSTFRLDYIHPDDVEAVMSGLYYVIYGTETQWEDSYRFKKADDTYAYVTNKGFVIRDSSGKALRMVGAKRDMTKQREEELRLQLLESVITNTSDMVIITEAEPIEGEGPKIIYVNDAFTSGTGYSKEDVIGKTPRLLQGPKTDKQELEKLKKALENWQSHNITVLNYKKNGDEFWNNMSISPVADANGWYTHWIAVERDVTERVQRNADIIQAIIRTQEEERYEVGAELHDNVCQILTSSKISFKMLESVVPDNKRAVFNNGIETLNLAFKEIRNLSHRLAPVFLDDTTLEQAFSNTLKSFNANEHYIIDLQFDEAFKAYHASKEFQLNLYRILQEQLNNILKYAKASTISVQGMIEDNKLCLSIIDDGIGFNSKLVSTGIGLSNMKRRAELFGGELIIESELGKGCKLTVEIPLTETN